MTGYKITSHAILGWIFLSGLAFDAFGHATEYNTFSNAFIHIHSLLWNYAPKAFRTGAKQLWWMGYSLPVDGIPSLVYKSNQCNSDRVASNDKRENSRMKDKQSPSALSWNCLNLCQLFSIIQALTHPFFGVVSQYQIPSPGVFVQTASCYMLHQFVPGSSLEKK